jgi:hypothetical protein
MNSISTSDIRLHGRDGAPSIDIDRGSKHHHGRLTSRHRNHSVASVVKCHYLAVVVEVDRSKSHLKREEAPYQSEALPPLGHCQEIQFKRRGWFSAGCPCFSLPMSRVCRRRVLPGHQIHGPRDSSRLESLQALASLRRSVDTQASRANH